MAVDAPVPAPAPARARKQAFARERTSRADRVTYNLMVVPATLLFTFFITIPAVLGLFFSFTNFQGFGSWNFVGLANYQSLFTDPLALQAYVWTLGFSCVCVVATNVLGMAIALGLAARIRAQALYRAVYIIPMVLSALVIGYVFQYLFNFSIPALATALKATPFETSLLANPTFAWVPVAIVTVWQSTPQAVLLYLAGLSSIPTDVYEAGSIDGAGVLRQFRFITFPLMLGFVVINSVLTFKNFLGAYDIIVALTGVGQGVAAPYTTPIAMVIYNGMYSGDYSYSLANGVIFFLLTVLLSVAQLGLVYRRNGGGIGI